MFIDGRKLPNSHVVETDICIIGAGAVGISMALEFLNSNTSVTLIESGGFEFDGQTQSLYQDYHIGDSTYPLETNRLRYFGGTTNHWAGHCRPFDEFDFSVRDWIPHSGWPVTIDEMKPYFSRSQPIMGLGEYDYDSIEEYADKGPVEQRLIRSLHHLERAQEIGNSFKSVDNTFNFSSIEHLTTELLEWLNLDRMTVQKLSDEKLTKHLSQQIRNDFTNENIVIINKWMFSKTEAMLCVLADFHERLEINKDQQS